LEYVIKAYPDFTKSTYDINGHHHSLRYDKKKGQEIMLLTFGLIGW